ncbi:hypothetical protein BRADI_2g27540v3 [Brachypodium distachyon]|uniref:Uncharacterized protein n=1 Tax=Brachypodium distachyon TaxID=15368 RepID=A0A0Q3ILD9_BRADI|nr:hypothetical protein BRADI_2g27540v3 [Brachypodium distachyon]
MNPGRFESISPPNEFTSSAAAPATDPPSWPLASSAADSHWLQPARRRGAAAPPGLCVGAARSVSAEEDGDEQRGNREQDLGDEGNRPALFIYFCCGATRESRRENGSGRRLKSRRRVDRKPLPPKFGAVRGCRWDEFEIKMPIYLK